MADDSAGPVAGCYVCDKHRGLRHAMPGGPLWADELTVVTHIDPRDTAVDDVYLGHLLVEPRRHAPGLADLTADEARHVGQWASHAARALREEAGAEHVYAAVIGDGVPHLHLHLMPRYPGTPREYWWDRVNEWPDGPHGGVAEAAELVARLRSVTP
ncbi:HIT family protein [Streptomyces sp. NPDC051940]|uniref:HIT family protein n=1 Tax=Streptomyces sp. NPDC051940 TaxID=3155675 RepID=UPI003437F0DB